MRYVYGDAQDSEWYALKYSVCDSVGMMGKASPAPVHEAYAGSGWGARREQKRKTKYGKLERRCSDRVLATRYWHVRGNDGQLHDAPAVYAWVWRLGLDPARYPRT